MSDTLPSAATLALALSALTAVFAWGCDHPNTYGPGCGLLSAPDHESDPDHCGGCGVVCDLVGAVPACVDGVCRAEECQTGFFDLDGDPSNGCECRGATRDACTLCLAYDRFGDGHDDDCDDRVDEDPTANPTSSVIPISRAHCGAVGASCLLDKGAEAVECAYIGCDAADYAAGHCGFDKARTICTPADGGDRYDCGMCYSVYPQAGEPEVTHETFEQCFDALDNDGNGVADDGPECEVLLANARTTACSGAAPSEECPAYHIAIPTNELRLPTLDVAFTYDVLFDRHEVTRQQYAAHLTALGSCDPERRAAIDPKCRVASTEALLPVSAVSWHDALGYCRARGKRLPTYAEFARAALADNAAPGDPVDTQSRSADALCDAVPAPVLIDCGADAPDDATTWAGDAYVGSRKRPEWWLSAKAIRHLTGNVSEWMLDYYVDWCAAARGGQPELSVIVCPPEGESGWAHQRGPLVDFGPSLDPFGPAAGEPERMTMGGAFAGPADAWRLEHRERNTGEAMIYGGFRCARTLIAPEYRDPFEEGPTD